MQTQEITRLLHGFEHIVPKVLSSLLVDGVLQVLRDYRECLGQFFAVADRRVFILVSRMA